MGNFFQSVASSRPVVVNRFLDDQTNVVAFYSLRRLISTYSGPALTIRRDSDNQETDIYFDGNDILNTDAIYEFCGSGVSAYVKVWYDQSSSGLDLSQTDTTRQPQIFDGTSVTSNEGKPSVGVSNAVSSPILSNSNFTPSVQNGYSYFVACGPTGYNAPVMHFRDTVMAAETTGQPTHDHAYINNRWQSINVDTTGYPNVGQRIAGNSVIQSAHYDGSGDGEVYISRNDGYNFSGLSSTLGSPSSQIYGSGIDINHKAAMSELMIFNSDKSSIRETIESNINDFYGFAQLNNQLLLDTYTDVFSAYSLRKLRSAYTGSCIEVYNGTSYADIGFTSQNELDIEALNTHCGSNNGLISKWYDQSTTANTAVQTATGSMPQIYNGSTQQVLIDNGKPFASATNSVENCFLRASVIPSLTNASHFMVVSRDAIGSSTARAILAYGTAGNQNDTEYSVLGGNGGSAQVGADLHINGIPNSATQKNTFYNALGSSYRIVNSQKNYQTQGADNFIIGQGTYNMFETKEIIIFNSDQSNNRVAIEANLNKYWKVY
jgi:hypothetical protein